MKSLQKVQVKDIFMRLENVYDNREAIKFLPFVTLKCKSNRDVEDDANDKITNVVFSLFCIETLKITSSTYCNVPPIDQNKLHPRHISLTRSSDVLTTHSGEPFAHSRSKRSYVPTVE